MNRSTHEDFSRQETVAIGSDRSFGIVMATAFSLFAALSGWNQGTLWPYLAAVAALFLAAALIYPVILNPLNRLWMKFGAVLHRLVSPIVMGLIFYGAVLPTGLAMRAFGKDLLDLKRQPKADSYWILRSPPGPTPDSMKNQF